MTLFSFTSKFKNRTLSSTANSSAIIRQINAMFTSIATSFATLQVYATNLLTAAELQQLMNIDSETITNTQWGYLGALDQDLSSTSDVQFDDVTVDGILGLSGANPVINSEDVDGVLTIQAVSTGANILLYGISHATQAGDMAWRVGTSITMQYDHSATDFDFQGNSITTTGNLAAAAGAFSGNINMNGAAPQLFVGSSAISTGTANIEVGAGRTGDGASFIDLVGDTTFTDFGLRVIRYGGANASSEITHRGTGTFGINVVDGGSISLKTSNADRITVSAAGLCTFASGTSVVSSGDLTINTNAFFVDASEGRAGVSANSLTAIFTVGNTGDNVLGTSLNDEIEVLELTTHSGNADRLRTKIIRTAAGSDWQTAAHRMQRWVDVTPMGYMQFGNFGSDLITFGESGTEYMRIDGSGNVGIGATPTVNLHVQGSGTTVFRLVTENNAASSRIDFGDIDDPDVGRIQYSHAANAFQFFTNGAEVARFDSAGDLGIGVTSPQDKLDVDGDIRLTGGITFDAGSNHLEHYEEGTWTPEVADAVTGGNTATGTLGGHYVRIGRQVTLVITCQVISTTGMTGANDLIIRNLPFTSAHLSGSNHLTGPCLMDNTTFAGHPAFDLFDQTDYIRVSESNSAAGHSFVSVSDLISGFANIEGCFTYFTDDA